ncbi:2'-5' RNA ligase family protein [Sabulibacter ruber]|uniref:2'-5' RNA ligase family protein n=1 Tax=Sabulibacter ruber TaxID=2811901 RepID=UPI001A97B685|nr:2'-5' RNA ligase family protein [Sabulibacter ruber]
MELRAHYTQLWESTEARFKENQYEFDALLDSPTDTRLGITLLARPQGEALENILSFVQEMASLEPEQYYYPASDVHITLLSIISCYPGFKVDQIELQQYIDLVKEALVSIKPFNVEFKGITASPSCVMVQGFPQGDDLQNLRDNLRTVFRNSGLQQSIDQRYAISTAHSTVIRFRKPLQRPQAFLQKLQTCREHDFGTALIKQVELVSNDWYQRKENTQLLATFPLT